MKTIMKYLVGSLLLGSLSAFGQTATEISDARTNPTPLSATLPGEVGIESTETGAPARKRSEKGSLDSADRRNLLDFYIPSAILIYGIEPATVSKVTLGLTDTKFSFKYGLQLGDTTKKKLVSGLGFAFSAVLSDAARTLFSRDDIPRDFSGSIIFTQVTRDALYVVDQGGKKSYSSSWAQWLNASLTGSISQKNVFTGDTTYQKYTNFNGQFLVSFTNLFNSLYGRYKYTRNIWNAGIGIGSFDNYASLSSYTLRRSVLSANQRYIGETSVVVGRRGDFRRMSGLIGTASVFYPLTGPTKLTSLLVGANGTLFGLGSADYVANVNGGFFISHRQYDDAKKLTEKFSFGVVAVWSQLQKSRESGYANDNFSVILTAQVPISFQ